MKHDSRSFQSPFRFLVLLALAALLGGCATQATNVAMVPETIDTTNKHPGTVSIAVSGGSDAMGKIPNENFKQALADAITKSQVFSKVIDGTSGNYLLTVAMSNLQQPLMAIDMTVKVEAGWTLKRASGETVWQESILTEHTATMSDSVAGLTRMRLATEGAARKNIAAGLAKISKLKL